MRLFTRALTILVAVPFLLGAMPVQSQYHEQIRVQLGAVESTLLQEGYQQTHDFYIDALYEDDGDIYVLTLRDDMEYQIVAVCDEDCTDIDLYLYDENENLIDEDETDDDVPVIESRPRWTGGFGIEVEMYECYNEPCYFGIGVFGRRR